MCTHTHTLMHTRHMACQWQIWQKRCAYALQLTYICMCVCKYIYIRDVTIIIDYIWVICSKLMHALKSYSHANRIRIETIYILIINWFAFGFRVNARCTVASESTSSVSVSYYCCRRRRCCRYALTREIVCFVALPHKCLRQQENRNRETA